MTECKNIEFLDMLPDFAAERLAPVEAARVQRHLVSCEECASDLALLQRVRAARPIPPAVSVANVVAALPRAPRSITTARSVRNHHQMWRIAAAVGLVIVGGGSVLVSRTGGFESITSQQVDSVRAVSEDATATAPADTTGVPEVVAIVAPTETAVSFGNIGDYSDDEMNRILERIEQWDGATSTESMTTHLIVPINSGETNR